MAFTDLDERRIKKLIVLVIQQMLLHAVVVKSSHKRDERGVWKAPSLYTLLQEDKM